MPRRGSLSPHESLDSAHFIFWQRQQISPGWKRSSLGESPNRSVPQFPHMQSGDSNGTQLIGCSETVCTYEMFTEAWLVVRALAQAVAATIPVAVVNVNVTLVEFVKLPHPCFFPSEFVYPDFV